MDPKTSNIEAKLGPDAPKGSQHGPGWGQDGQKIEAKIDQFFDASWGRFLERFGWILTGKMEASWFQNRDQKSIMKNNTVLTSIL